MTTYTEINGPYVVGFGCHLPNHGEPSTVAVGRGPIGHGVYQFAADGVVSIHPETSFRKFGWPNIESIREHSCIPRAGYASRASVLAASVACAMKVAGFADSPPLRLGVALATSTGGIDVALRFEERGLKEGWSLVDPLAFPNTIPSSLSTQVAIACQAKAFSATLLTGLLAAFQAIEFAVLAVLNQRADCCLVIGAEEVGPFEERLLGSLRRTPNLTEGAAGLALSWQRTEPVAWRIGLIGHSSEGSPALPASWAHAPIETCASPDAISTLLSFAPFVRLSELLSHHQERVILCGYVPFRGRILLGFVREE